MRCQRPTTQLHDFGRDRVGIELIISNNRPLHASHKHSYEKVLKVMLLQGGIKTLEDIQSCTIA